MSEVKNHRVPYTTIQRLEPHGNADRLEIAYVYGFGVIVQKDRYKVGDAVVYCPIDSMFTDNQELENIVAPKDGKIKLNNCRVRQIKIRGIPSQGLLLDPKDLVGFVDFTKVKLETDLSDVLKITKYEPPVTNKGPAGKPGGRKKMAHPDFHSYNGLLNIKWDERRFLGKQVVIQEKLHGTNARAAILPYRTNTLWRKFLKWINLAPQWENLYGSNRVDITNASSYNGYYGEDVYGATFAKINIFGKLKPNETVFGEIIGPGIQKNYHYGLQEHKFVLFDVKILNEDGTQTWLDPEAVKEFAIERKLDFVPVLYMGEFDKALCESLVTGPSVYCREQKVREGIVIKARENYSNQGNKEALKMISPDYLNDPTNTDEH